MNDGPNNSLCSLGNPASNSAPPTYDVSAVSNPAPNNVYDSYRWGPASYAVHDLNPNTLYTVRLHFCENEFTAANARLFNVFLNGNPVLQNFDIFATAGAMDKVLIYTYAAMSDGNGNIQIDTTQGPADQPEISAIDVTPNNGANNLPAAPTGLAASAISTNQIAVNWNPVGGAASYNVFRLLSPTFTPSAATYAETVTGTSVTDNVLYTGTTYYYEVAAVNSAGQGPASTIANATTFTSPAGVIAGIDCGGPASGDFAVDQDFSNGVANTFDTTIDTSALSGAVIPSQAVLQTDREGNFGYTFSNLTPGQPITVTLYFMENYWTAAGSRLFNVTLNGNQVLTNFDIYATAGAKYKAIQQTFTAYVNSAGQIDLQFAPTVDNAQCSAILLSRGPNIPVPAAPAAVASDLASGATMVSWSTADTSITGYNVYRATTPGGEGTTPYASDFSGTNFMDTNVTNGVTYYYKVAAVNFTGTSALSPETSAVPGPWPVPGIVQSENFDIGGEGVAYHSTATSNLGGFYRTSENVGIEQTLDVGGGYDVCYTSAGQWINYTVDVAAAGTYTVDFRIAGYGGGPIHIQDVNGNNLTGEVNVPSTNGWEVWSDVTATLTLPAGVQTLTFYEDGGNFNINYMTFSYNGATEAPPAPMLQGIPGDTTATLTWQPSPGATSYNLYRGTSSGGETRLVGGLAATSYTDTGLSDGTTYYYEVSASNSLGASPLSNEVPVTPIPPPPAAPSGLTAIAGNAQATLSWNTVSAATSYNVYRGTTPGGESATPVATGVTASTYTDTGLSNGTTYYYVVAAVNLGGVSGPSNEASTTPNLPPPAPGNLTASAGSRQATLSWSAAAGATSYLVYRATVPGGEAAPSIAAGLTGTTYTDNGLTNGATYYYTVAAVNAGGVESGMSNEASATPEPVAGSGGVDIDCGGPAAAPYVADVDFTGGGTQVVGNTIDTSQLTGNIPPQAVLQSNRYGNVTYAIPGLTPSGTYTVTLYFAEEYWSTAGSRIFDVSIDGSQVLTNFDIVGAAGGNYTAVQQSFTTTADPTGTITIVLTSVKDNALVNAIAITGSGGASGPTVPAAPDGLTATPGNGQVQLAWNSVTNAASYNLYRAIASGAEGSTPYKTGLAGTSYTDANVTNGVAYYYKLTAIDSAGASAQSTEVSATPNAPGPTLASITAEPKALLGDQIGAVTLTLTGPAPAGGVTVPLMSEDRPAAKVSPTSVFIPAGSSTGTAVVKGYPVTVDTLVTLNAKYGGVSHTCHVTVLAPVVQKVEVLPSKVVGGAAIQTGTVTLTSPAPVVMNIGIAVDSPNAIVPGYVLVQPGHTTATFQCKTKVVTTEQTATITATGASNAASCTITIKPE